MMSATLLSEFIFLNFMILWALESYTLACGLIPIIPLRFSTCGKLILL